MPSANPAPRQTPFGQGRRVIGSLIAIAIAALIVALFGSILAVSVEASGTTPSVDLAHLLRMTAIQAGLTTFLSLLVGTGLAWALNRLKFFGRDALASLFAAAIVAPGLVVAFGLIAVWGRAGWIGEMFGAFGMDWTGSIFGLHGILAAHVILDGAFAARVLLTRLDALPATRLKIGQSLALSPAQRFRLLDWPALSGALPGLGAIIFLLAFTSFPIVLLLGGGPANQTLEVAIYAAVRLNFDLQGAVGLALVQLGVCAIIIAPMLYFAPDISVGGSSTNHHWPQPLPAHCLAIGVLFVGLVGFALPLIAVLINGLGPGLGNVLSDTAFWQAVKTSLAIGATSALLTLCLSVGLGLGRSAFTPRWAKLAIGVPAYTYLIVPAVVLSLGFFLGVRSLGLRPQSVAPMVLVLANGLLALPFAMAVLGPALNAIDKRYARPAQSLGLSGWQRWQVVELPLLHRELSLVLALGFCFSLGDLGTISLFGTNEFATLPWLMFRALGAYRSNDAAAIAALLLLLTFVAFWLPTLFTRDRQNA